MTKFLGAWVLLSIIITPFIVRALRRARERLTEEGSHSSSVDYEGGGP